MIKFRFHYQITSLLLLLFAVVSNTVVNDHTPYKLQETFDSDEVNYTKVGRGECFIKYGKLVSRDAYATFGNKDWRNYRFSFEAKVPETEEQVQICAGFREQGRNERYIVGLQSGLQHNMELGRMGHMRTNC